MKVIERLSTLKKLNGNVGWLNKDLFRLVCSPDFAVLAFEKWKSGSGKVAAGADISMYNLMSKDRLIVLCDAIRDGSYSPAPIRRRSVSRANGAIWTLGIAAPIDRVVQEMVREVLESIFDSPVGSTFSKHSHKYRPERSCHTAIREFSTWHGAVWLVQGDIEGFFNNLDHHVLMGLLRGRIKDERF